MFKGVWIIINVLFCVVIGNGLVCEIEFEYIDDDLVLMGEIFCFVVD